MENINKILNSLPSTVQCIKNADMSKYNSFQVGGNCPYLLNCCTSKDLISTIKLLSSNKIRFSVIGEGTNILVSDNGIDFIIIRYCNNDINIFINDNLVTASGHIILDDLVSRVIEKGLGDISFLSGIPGTFGGAIAGNAGAFGKQIGDYIISAKVVDNNGNVNLMSRDSFNFKYRSSSLKRNKNILIEASLDLEFLNSNQMKKNRRDIISLRISKHPDWKNQPCAGSIFRNIEPTSNAKRRQAAGWFLEQSGVKDFYQGGAYVFEKHANIIIAGNNATAKDIYILSERMKKAVKEKFGIDLIREIELLGLF